MMIIICGYFLVDEGDRDRVVEAHRDLVARARAFVGCIDLSVAADSVDPRRINNLEVWTDADALEGWREVANPPTTGATITGGDMTRYNAEDGGPIF